MSHEQWEQHQPLKSLRSIQFKRLIIHLSLPACVGIGAPAAMGGSCPSEVQSENRMIPNVSIIIDLHFPNCLSIQRQNADRLGIGDEQEAIHKPHCL
jgi:hypothetical protein